MSNELITRLRHIYADGDPITEEAADLIEAQQSELRVKDLIIGQMANQLSGNSGQLEKQQRRIEELEALLNNAANYLNETATCNSDKAVASTLTRGIGKSHLGLYYQLAVAQKRIELYEQALKASWPDGAMGDAFDYWNAARKEDV